MKSVADSADPARAETTILYADDTDAQRYALSRVLRQAGFGVIEAKTGRQALAMMSARPNLVVLDVNLPDISGLEVCKAIKTEDSTKRIPVLHVSASLITAGARVAGLEGGADAYLVQPIAPEELIATIRALLRVRQAEDALHESQEQYRLFFEANPLACWAFDSNDLKILAVNAAGIDLYGYSRDEFLRLTLRDLVFAGDVALATTDANGSSGLLGSIGKHKTKTGKVIDVETVCAPLSLAGHSAQLAIVQDVTDKLQRQAAEQEQEVRRLLLDRLLHAQEEERRRIARDLHDEAGQLMTSLLVGLRTLSDSRRLTDAKSQAKHLREIASGAIGELTRLARGLHTGVLDDLGLEVAIERLADDFRATQKIKLDLTLPEKLPALGKHEQINIYRIIQEALTNVARHSNADHAKVNISCTGSELMLSIGDNGRGFDNDGSRNPSGSLGIEGMRERAAMSGGMMELISVPREGVSVNVRLPLQPPRKTG